MPLDGAQTFHYYGETPWDGVGHDITKSVTVDQILQDAKLDWKVIRKIPTYHHRGKEYAASKHELIRDDDGAHLTSVPPKWHILQNRDGFETFAEWVKLGNMKFISAGSLSGGRKVWVCVEVRHEFEAVANDHVKDYLLFTLPHEYGKSIDLRQIPRRLTCNNMITFMLQRKSSLTIRWDHRKKFDKTRIETVLNLSKHNFDKYATAARFLVSKRAKLEDVKEFALAIYPANDRGVSKNAAKVLAVLEEQPGANFAPGSWWQAFNAVTYCENHLFGRHRDTALHSLWYGKGVNRSYEALNLAVEYADAS